jgi:hypothetical protein
MTPEERENSINRMKARGADKRDDSRACQDRENADSNDSATISRIFSQEERDNKGVKRGEKELARGDDRAVTTVASTGSAELVNLKQSVHDLEVELESLSLSQAKRYALKKKLAMERSKLIREERRLGLQKGK